MLVLPILFYFLFIISCADPSSINRLVSREATYDNSTNESETASKNLNSLESKYASNPQLTIAPETTSTTNQPNTRKPAMHIYEDEDDDGTIKFQLKVDGKDDDSGDEDDDVKISQKFSKEVSYVRDYYACKLNSPTCFRITKVKVINPNNFDCTYLHLPIVWSWKEESNGKYYESRGFLPMGPDRNELLEQQTGTSCRIIRRYPINSKRSFVAIYNKVYILNNDKITSAIIKAMNDKKDYINWLIVQFDLWNEEMDSFSLAKIYYVNKFVLFKILKFY
jgi:hypothetical protein